MLLGRLILEGNPHTADIVFCKPGMNTEKMSVETFAQPVPEFRHHHPMLDLLIIVFIKGPRIIPPTRSRVVRLPSPNSNPMLGVEVAQ